MSLFKIENQNLKARRHWLNRFHVWKYFYLERVPLSLFFNQQNIYWNQYPKISLRSIILKMLRLGDVSYFHCQFLQWMRGQEWLKMLVLYLPVRDLKMLSQVNSTIIYRGWYVLVAPGLCPRDVHCYEEGRHLCNANKLWWVTYSYFK